jgi:hypothetical protein
MGDFGRSFTTFLARVELNMYTTLFNQREMQFNHERTFLSIIFKNSSIKIADVVFFFSLLSFVFKLNPHFD